MKTPDTTKVVAKAIADAGFEDFHNECSHYSGGSGTCRAPEIRPLAVAAIAADRKALADQGYVIVRRKNLSDYINQHHYVVDGEWGSSRSIKKLMLDGAVNEDYRLFGLL